MPLAYELLATHVLSEAKEGDVAVFDFDGTCIEGDVGIAALKYLPHGEAIAEEFARLAEIDYQKAAGLCVQAFRGFPVDGMPTFVQKLMSENPELILRAPVIDLGKFLKAKGLRILIVTASFEPLVREAVRFFGLDFEVCGVRLGKNGNVFSSDISYPAPIMGGKVECIKNIFGSRNPLFAISDSRHDIPMLEYASYAAVVGSSETLRAEAHKRGWEAL